MPDNVREFEFSDADFRYIADFARAKVGIAFSQQKKEMIYSRLSRRLRALDLSDFAEYRSLLESKQGITEIENLVNAVTTNITSFFRESHHFDHVVKTVVPEIIASGERRMRFWSAGCSMGMEAYSLAASLASAVPDVAQWDIKILATDIDTNVLVTGREGIYDEQQLSKIPPALAKKYFTHHREQEQMEVSEVLKRMVSFKPLNLLEPWPVKGPFDAIFCRNVVIYFDKNIQRKLFERFSQLLKPQGWLYIGHSENLFNVSDAFELLGRTIYRKR
ncbi:MAG: protein-glutamate O-methyltransferase [Rickettsiales bacterium]|nr:protein-glutamate O-methyltransferase [Rickettsiales bacterium]